MRPFLSMILCTRKLKICLTLKSTDCGREASLRPKDAAFVAGQTTKTNKVNVCLIKVAVMFLIFENLLHSRIHLKVRKSRIDFFKETFPPKTERTDSTLLL